MFIAASIRQRGFRKWYERELLHSHSHLVLLLLCALAVLGAVEAFAEQRGSQRLLLVACLLAAAAIGLWALRRYLLFLTRAEHIANQAVCPQCKVYGRWRVEQDETGPDGSSRMVVCCRGCSHRWQIQW